MKKPLIITFISILFIFGTFGAGAVAEEDYCTARDYRGSLTGVVAEAEEVLFWTETVPLDRLSELRGMYCPSGYCRERTDWKDRRVILWDETCLKYPLKAKGTGKGEMNMSVMNIKISHKIKNGRR